MAGKGRPERSKNFNTKCASGIISCVRVIAVGLLIISGWVIISSYLIFIFWSIQPSSLAQAQINSSIQIFIGAGAFLALYSYETEKFVKKMLGVQSPEQYKYYPKR